MSKADSKPRWSIERRLEFIEFRLFWEGKVNRSDLRDYFGISVPQASADLSAYQEAAEGNMVYDKTAKAYVVGTRFKPIYITPSADRYLAQLRLLDAGLLSSDETWVSRPPPHAIVATLRRRLPPHTLSKIMHAIHIGSSVEVNYQSFSRPEPTWRRLTPHALAFDGIRWHVRAWCHTRLKFLDFVVGRIFATRKAKPDSIDPTADVGWTTQVTLQVGPHPKLNEGSRRAIELDYGMEEGVVEVTSRACMVQYLRKRLGLDKDPETVDPIEQHIVLLNRVEVEQVLRASGITLNLSSANEGQG